MKGSLRHRYGLAASFAAVLSGLIGLTFAWLAMMMKSPAAWGAVAVSAAAVAQSVALAVIIRQIGNQLTADKAWLRASLANIGLVTFTVLALIWNLALHFDEYYLAPTILIAPLASLFLGWVMQSRLRTFPW